ncbi:MAG TPA: cobalamin-binding protein [Thermoanaerobaculia bacterium]|nr:cobalamin-binding protein [Thermoanaerobaculia bacterium]
MRRILSLLPSATEIVAALGASNELVGRSHECDFPAEVARLPVCTAPKVRVTGTSEEIHRSVTEVLERDISVYRVDGEMLRSLRPDVIVTQVQCDICAVSLRDVEAVVGEWMGGDEPRIVALNPSTVSSICSDIGLVAEAIGRDARGLLRTMQVRIDAMAGRAQSAAARPVIATIEWISPLMAAGNWVPELIELAGGRNALGMAGRHSPWIHVADLMATDPDIIVVMPCGFSIEKSLADLPLLTGDATWRSLRAVRNGRVFVADGHSFFNRPGPRIVESLEILAEMVHPELFDFGHRQTDWVVA